MLSVDEFISLHEEGYRRSDSGEAASAIECYERALTQMTPGVQYPGVANVRGNLMQCYAQVGRIDAAWEQATRAIQSASLLADAQRGSLFAQLAWFFSEHAPLDRLASALPLVDEAIALLPEPHVLPAMDTKMRVLLRLGREGEAKAVARAALAANPNHPDFADVKHRWGLGVERGPAKRAAFVRRLDVKGLPPRSTLGMRAVYAASTNRIYFFGGVKRPSESTREDEVRQRNTVFALVPEGASFRWEGPTASAVSDPLENFESAVLPRSQHVWSATANPRYLMAHGGANHDDRGVTFMDQGGLADWLAFDLELDQWRELSPPLASASAMPLLVGHGSVFDPRSGRIVMLRAAANEKELASHGPAGMRTLNGLVFETKGEPEQWTHRRLPAKGVGPSVRAGYGFVVVGSRAILFGGAYTRSHAGGWRTDWPEDVWLLDLGTFAWRLLTTTGPRPAGRVDHGLLALDDDRVLVGAGRHGAGDQAVALDELHVLDLGTEHWHRVGGELHAPPGATWTAFGEGRERRVLVVGGDAEGVPVFEIDVSAL